MNLRNLPQELREHIAAARLRAERQFREDQKHLPDYNEHKIHTPGQPCPWFVESAQARRLLISRIMTEVLEVAQEICAFARKGEVRALNIDPVVDKILVMRCIALCPEPHTSGDRSYEFEREVRANLQRSEGWDAHLAERELLLAVENRQETLHKAQESFATPPGTQWQDIAARVTDTTITIEAKRSNQTFSFQSAGFEEKRKRGVPNRNWALLRVFAMHGGMIPYDCRDLDHKTRTNLRQYISVLRRSLRALIPGIDDGDPIPHVRNERCYRMSFKIGTSDTLILPVPDGTAWPDVTIELTRSGAIRISVPTTERYATATYAEESGGDVHRWEAAERESKLEHDYDLRMLRLADNNGRPDARGVALLEVLSANGAVSRPADDDTMLDLCGVLTKLMDVIDSSPFDFDSGHQKWVALFQTSRE